MRRQIDQHAGVKFEIGVDRADLEPAGLDQRRELAALRTREGEIEPARDAALEDGKMAGERQHRLHHMQIMQPRRGGLRERCSQEIGLLLVVTFDHDAVAGLDDRLEQFGGSLRWTDF